VPILERTEANLVTLQVLQDGNRAPQACGKWATFMPARINASSRSSLLVAGPIVQTILVRRI